MELIQSHKKVLYKKMNVLSGFKDPKYSVKRSQFQSFSNINSVVSKDISEVRLPSIANSPLTARDSLTARTGELTRTMGLEYIMRPISEIQGNSKIMDETNHLRTKAEENNRIIESLNYQLKILDEDINDVTKKEEELKPSILKNVFIEIHLTKSKIEQEKAKLLEYKNRQVPAQMKGKSQNKREAIVLYHREADFLEKNVS